MAQAAASRLTSPMTTDPTAAGDAVPTIDPSSDTSARAVMARVIGLTGARSVVDIGSGTGAWSRACREVGVPEVVGVDGAYVAAEHRVHPTAFIERDLAEPLDLGRSFGLVICVDVAEDLSPERAPGLVADVTGLAPVVLFAAAVPGQIGGDHVNEQWSEYWVALFDAEGWTCRDAIRPWVRTNEDVAWQLRQSLFLAVAPSVEQAYTSFPRLAAVRPEHPVEYLVRPAGDVMTPPLPPVPEPEAEPVTVIEPSVDVPPPPPFVVPNAPDEAAVLAPDAPAAANGNEAAGAEEAGDDEDISFPQPPGWATLRRMAGRARRRSGD